jgi:translation initiation factor 2 subunit 2
MKIPIPNTEENLTDPSYRYQRDVVKINKSGQQYVLENIVEIASQLHVSVDSIKKFLQNKLNQPVILDKKTNQLKIKSITSSLENYIEEYIKLYVLCKKCNKPELDNKKCKCCGYNNI